uniref:Uncharacterized protein n=1 Tax=Rhizophora mucronata TaxID=61149 RepID=A0A2P2QH19_RHIMU
MPEFILGCVKLGVCLESGALDRLLLWFI